MNLASAKALMARLQGYDKVYFNTGKSKVPDRQYDHWKDELSEANKKLKDKSIKAYLESTGVEELGDKKVKHNFYLPSLNKIKDDEPKALPKYLAKVKKCWRLKDKPLQFVLGPKFDGSSVEHVYEGGKYKQSITRGDGWEGRDVSNHCRELIKLGKMPLLIPEKEHIRIRSEVCITRKDFAPWKGKKVGSYTYKEARNSANSYLTAKTVKKDFAKVISVIAFDCFDRDGNAHFPTKFKAVKAMAEWGFSNLFEQHIRLATATMDLKAELDRMLEYVSSEKFPIECDGVVIEANSSNLRAAMRVGMEDKRPTHAMAYKYGRTTDKTAQTTKVKRLFWTAAADGARVPNVEYDAIKVGNTTLTNALVHNAAMVEELGIVEGCEVKVVRSGGVIPQVVEVTKAVKGKSVVLPTKCSCGSKLKRQGPDLYCTNKDCAETNEAKFSRSCKFMSLDGLGGEGEKKLFAKCGTVAKVFHLKVGDLQKVLGNVAGQRVYASIQKWKAGASWADLMVVSGAFTRSGFSLAGKALEKIGKAGGIDLTKAVPKSKGLDVKPLEKLKGKVKGEAGDLFNAGWANFVKFVNSI
jgi:DNA ligase (NAD+)